MAQQLATLAFLPEDLGLVLGTHGVDGSQPSVNPILGDQTPTLASVGTRHAQYAKMCLQEKDPST